ncbi:RNA polymerase sigma factor [Fulvivirga ligni]|uniref:RNA polymerase sigma factor n=1 Tax=Fulvivirga ligni TaxID=2904246 RepID=UPI001F2BBB65|nr:sigma-70 family RNA polymerase sigma factor [Fulvivirga ligni]UII19176.1 sigma-70 family RNA polymerase sigma factor [Fulvivirga ligni]
MRSKDEFVRLIKENEGIIFKISRVYASDEDDQKDLYQEIVYQLWKSFESFREESKVSTWMYRVALNTSISHLNRRNRKEKHHVPIDLDLHIVYDEKDTVMEERVNMLYAQIKQLSVVEKGIILLFLEGKNYDEIAAITGFTSSNVGTRLSRIKQKLKSQIKNS